MLRSQDLVDILAVDEEKAREIQRRCIVNLFLPNNGLA